MMITTRSGAPRSQAMMAGMGLSFQGLEKAAAHQRRAMVKALKPMPSSR